LDVFSLINKKGAGFFRLLQPRSPELPRRIACLAGRGLPSARPSGRWNSLTAARILVPRMPIVGPHRRAALASIVTAIAVLAAVTCAAVPSLAQAPKAVTAGPVLDREQLRKILKRLDEAGRTRVIPVKVTAALGATKGDETLDVREIAFERGDYEHGFYKGLKAGDDRIILAFRTPEKKWTAFLTNSRLKLVAAVSWNAGETPTRWEGAEASQAFENELAYWAILADTF
jgi:hypothetical protein